MKRYNDTMIGLTGPRANYNSVRHSVSGDSVDSVSGRLENIRETHHEENIVKIIADAGGYSPVQHINNNNSTYNTNNKSEHNNNVNHALNYNDNTRAIKEKELELIYKRTKEDIEERKRFAKLFEMGIYYIHNGKLCFDKVKYAKLQLANDLNTKFDEKVIRKAHKKYNKIARKRFGYQYYHNSPEEQRLAKPENQSYRDLHNYDEMMSLKKRIEDKYKHKYEKKRQRYIKKQFKKKNRFNKWINKKEFNL